MSELDTYTTIREAQVLDTNDEKKAGRIQIRILPEMLDISKDLCPWVEQYSNGTGLSSTSGKHTIYEKDSYVRVLIEDMPFMKRIRIISDDYIEGLYIYQNLDLSSISELGSQTYPQPVFQMFADGTINFHNTESGETGTLYKSGGYYLVDADGNIFINSNDKELKFYNSKGSLDLDANGKMTIDFKSDLNLTISGNSKITTTGTTDIESTGDLTIKGSGNLTINGLSTKITGGTFQMNGTCAPTGTGPLCGIPACLFTGAPQTGTTVTGT